MDGKKIIIDLSGPLAAKSVENEDNLIQRPAWDAIKKLIASQLKEGQGSSKRNDGVSKDDCGCKNRHEQNQAASDGSDINIDRRHNTITITGGRGSGKTTFMLSLVDLLRRKNDEEGNFNGIVWLRLIDPTLLENKENILITVLSEIYRRIDSHYRNRDQDHEDWEQKYKDWHHSLQKLAEGITVLDGVGSSSNSDAAWEDPQHVLEQGLSRAKSGMNLERCLHQFIERSLAFLDKKAFLLVFDDIDTRFDRGWVVLEVIRKYLTSPKLIVIILGDMHLYSMLVRQQQWAMLNNKMHEMELERFAVHEDIDHLQSQYLHKLLKIQNRVQMRTLDALIALKYDLRILPCHLPGADEKSDIEIKLPEMIRQFCECALFLKNKADIDAICHLILHQPVRNVLHLLSTTSVNQLLRCPATGALKVHPDTDEENSKEEYLRGVHDVLAYWCMDALYAYRVYTDELQETTEDNILNLVVNFLNTSELWQDGYRLKPEFREDQRSLAMLALGSRVGLLIRKAPKLLAQYFIGISLTREAAKMKDTLAYQEFVGLTTIRSLLNTACRTVGYFRSKHDGMVDDNGPKQGSISVEMQPAPISMPEFQRSLAGLPALRLIDAAGDSHGYLSIYPLIAIISDLLSSGITSASSVDLNLRRWGQIRSFSVYCEPYQLGRPPLPQPRPEGTAIPFEFMLNAENQADSTEIPISTYVEHWVKWANKKWINNNAPLPAHVLGDIWSRFHHTLEHIDEISGNNYGAGDYLHLYIVAFLNSVLVEEHLARNMEKPIILFNHVEDPRVFPRNLENYNREQYCWFDLFFSFPLWGLYLRPDSGDLIYKKQIMSWHPIAEEQDKQDDYIFQKRHEAFRRGFREGKLSYSNLYDLYNSALKVQRPHQEEK